MSSCNANRVFVTGLSALTACGNTLDETWQAILKGRHGLGEISQSDLSTWDSRLGGELKNFKEAASLPDKKWLKVISRQDVMGINAAVQAVNHSQLIDHRNTLDEGRASSFNEDTAVFVGSPGNKFYQQYDFLKLLSNTNADMQPFAHQLFDEVHPMWLLRILPNNVLAYTGITYGFKGPNHNVTNHAVGGTQAILEAYHAIRSGQAERAVVVAYDVGTEPQALFYYDKLGVLSKRHLTPFDKDHDGTILAEGAGALVLESEASVKARKAQCFAEILGGFSASEGAGLFSLEPSGEPLSKLIQKSLDNAGVSKNELDLVVAHGNANVASDNSEAYAIRQADIPTQTPITAFKWAFGHTLCASGVLDAVLLSYALKNRCIPGVATLNALAPECEMLNIQPATRDLPRTNIRHHALMISRGFASMNACLVMASCD